MNYEIENQAPEKEKDSLLKALALFSIGLYIIVATVFDAVESSLSRFSSLAIYFCLICCAIYIFANGSFKLNYAAIGLLIFGAVLSFTTIYTPASATLVGMYLYRYWTSAVLVILITNVVTSMKDVERMATCYIAAGVALSVYMYSLYGFSNLATSLERMDKQMGNQNSLGMSCCFAIAFAVYKIVTEKKMIHIISIIVCMPALMFSGSRKSVIVLAIAIIIFFFYYSNDKMLISKVIAALIAVGAIVAMIYYVPAFQVIEDRFMSFLEVAEGNEDALTGTSDMNRMYYIEEGLRRFMISPLWGGGFNYSSYVFNAYTHNNYVELLMNGGLLAFCSFYSIYVSAFRNIGRMRRSGAGRKQIALIAMIIFSLTITDFGVVSYYERITLILLSFCCVKFIPSDTQSADEDNDAEDE